MSEPVWLSKDVVMAIQQILITDHGGLPGVRDVSLLESALSRPKQLIAYGDRMDVPRLAAAYCYGLARNHPFVDGNKRIALTVAGVFLEINDYVLEAAEPDAVIIIERLAAGEVNEDTLAAWFYDNVKTRGSK